MARIIAVHGTFAHAEVPAAGHEEYGPPVRQWWQAGSAFEREIETLVSSENGPIEVFPFVWSGDNSERDRRAGSSRLLEVFRELEARGAPYVAIGHSHGGSVISGALMEAASKNIKLPGLKRWITVGTPFVDLEKERFLFSRLPLLYKSIFVASLMLLVMFAFSTMSDIVGGNLPFDNAARTIRFLTSLTLTALPFLAFYIGARWHERRRLYFYRPRNIEKARAFFADRWLPLAHEDDEIINGLASLRSVNLNVFQEDFAIGSLTFGSVFVLPLAYLALLMSPGPMVGIADFLKTNVYAVSDFERVENDYVKDRSNLRSLRRQMRREKRKVSTVPDGDVSTRSDNRIEYESLRKKVRSARRELNAKYANVQQNDRAYRFKKRFLEMNGQACANGQLCYGGTSIRLNSKLLYHLVTDEVAQFIVDEELRSRTVTGILRYALPIILVPFVFGLLAVGLVLLVQFLARFVSKHLSYALDRLTWTQIRRSLLGNDTESEVATGAILRPFWIAQPRPFIPAALGDIITHHSNQVTASSLSKFRNAISELAFADNDGDGEQSIMAYLTWQELVHGSYFEVTEFRKVIALAIGQADGFLILKALGDDALYPEMTKWLARLSPGTPERSGV